MRRIALLVIALVAVIAVAAPAVAKPEHAAMNQPEYWETEGLHCYKVDGGFGDSYTTTRAYANVIVKGGPVHFVYGPVAADTDLYAALNPNSGKPYGISHIIFCKGPSGPSGPST